MLDHLISKLSISGSEDQNPDHHTSESHVEQRFETDINVYPERVSKSPRISSDVSYFLSMHGEDVGEVLKRPIAIIPEYDSSLSLASYFVSTSHNTYLVGDQLWGGASPSSYKHVLANGAHCVEIDVWPGSGPDGSQPIVTHGWTFTQDILFKDVCIAINEAVESKVDDWPVFVSLECHVKVEGQKELVEIMKECWGERLLSSRIEGVQGDNVSPVELKNRVVMMIEHYPSEGTPSGSDSESVSQEGNKKVKISDELTALGIYALSTKPGKNWLQEKVDQLHILINISESALLSLLPHALADLISHGQRHLRRVYPRGTRIMSGNLDPLVAWRAGSHFAALNWQEYDFGVQVNEAMFVGSSGWVPKPASMLEAGMGVVGETKRRGEAEAEEERVGLSVDVVGLSNLTHPEGKKDFRVHIRIYLYHKSGDKKWKSKSVKCKTASEDNHNAGADGMVNETCVWAFDKDELAFLRIVVEDDDEPFGLFCVRLQHLQQGYRFVRLLDKKGKDSHSTLLVNFSISSVN